MNNTSNAKIIELETKNETLRINNENLKLANDNIKRDERERLNNSAAWNKKSNKSWKKEIVRTYKAAGYNTDDIAGLFMKAADTINKFT